MSLVSIASLGLDCARDAVAKRLPGGRATQNVVTAQTIIQRELNRVTSLLEAQNRAPYYAALYRITTGLQYVQKGDTHAAEEFEDAYTRGNEARSTSTNDLHTAEATVALMTAELLRRFDWQTGEIIAGVAQPSSRLVQWHDDPAKALVGALESHLERLLAIKQVDERLKGWVSDLLAWDASRAIVLMLRQAARIVEVAQALAGATPAGAAVSPTADPLSAEGPMVLGGNLQLAAIGLGGLNIAATKRGGTAAEFLIASTMAPGRPLQTLGVRFTAHANSVQAMATDGVRMLLGSGDSTVNVWQLGAGIDPKPDKYGYVQTLTGHSGAVWALATDGVRWFSGSGDKTIKVWQLGTDPNRDKYGCVQTLTGHSEAVWALATDGLRLFSSSGSMFGLNGPDDYYAVKVWQLGAGPDRDKYGCVQTLTSHSDAVWALATDGLCLFSGSGPLFDPQGMALPDDYAVKVWQLGAGPDPKYGCVQKLTGHFGAVFALTTDGVRVFSGSRDKTVKVWQRGADPERPDQYVCIQTLEGHENEVKALATDGVRVFSGSGDKTVKVWQLGAGPDPKPDKYGCVQTLTGHSDAVRALATDGVRVFSGSGDKTVKVW